MKRETEKKNTTTDDHGKYAFACKLTTMDATTDLEKRAASSMGSEVVPKVPLDDSNAAGANANVCSATSAADTNNKKQKCGFAAWAKKEQDIYNKVCAGYTDRENIIITTEDGMVHFNAAKRSNDEISRLHSIADVPIAELSNKVLVRFCSYAKIPGYKDKNRKGICEVIVAYKLKDHDICEPILMAPVIAKLSTQGTKKVRLDKAAKLSTQGTKVRLDKAARKHLAMSVYDEHAEHEARLRSLKEERRKLKKQLKTAQNSLSQDSDDASDIASGLKRIDAQIVVTETAANRAMATITAFLEEK